MVASNKTINFHTVALAANVSVAYLYKNDELKQRIDQLRKNQSPIKGLQKQGRSENSQKAVITTLSERIKKLEAENRGLRDQNEVAYGMASRFTQLQQQITTLESENARLNARLNSLQVENLRLKQQLDTYSTPNSIESVSADLKGNVASLDDKRVDKKIKDTTVNEKIKFELDFLKIKLDSTLAKTIRSASESTVLKAIEALKEAMTTGDIDKPAGWLNRAIKDGWMPNEKYIQKVELDIFNEWYNLAKKQGLIMASSKGNDGKLYVYTPDGIQLPFEQMLDEYPLDLLRKQVESTAL